jgi:hypothetical protein
VGRRLILEENESLLGWAAFSLVGLESGMNSIWNLLFEEVNRKLLGWLSHF